jgi:hypothetical protein
MSDTYRSDPKRAAELAVILARHCYTAVPGRIAFVVADMQKAARAAQRAAEKACNVPMTEEETARAAKREERLQGKLNRALAELAPFIDPDARPEIELGGDPRGPCARLHIPGQKGDGWGDGFAVY